MTALQTAILALNGQQDANGHVLAVKRLFQDNTTGTVSTDLSGNAANGTYVNSPTLAVPGPLYNEANGGNAETYASAGPSYLNCGNFGALIPIINGDGLTLLFYHKSSQLTQSDLFGCLVAGKNGFEFLHGYAGPGTYSLYFSPPTGNPYGNEVRWSASNSEGIGVDTGWHMYEVYVSNLAADVQFRIDGALQPVTSTNITSNGGTYTNANQNFYYGASLDSQNFNGSLNTCTVISGKLTEAQRTTLLQAALRTIDGIAGVINWWDAANVLDASNQPCTENVYAKTIVDTCGNDNLVQASAASQAYYVNAKNFGRPALIFHNRCQSPAFGSVKRYYKKDNPTPRLQMHGSLLAAFRIITIQLDFSISQQTVLSQGAGGIERSAIATDCSNGTVGVGRYFSVYSPAGFPAVRCMPGLCVIAIALGKYGPHADRIWMNRFVSDVNTSGGTVNEAIDTISLAADTYLGGLANMWWENAAISSIPVTDEMVNQYIAARFSENGESINPPVHVYLLGNSIVVGQSANGANDVPFGAGAMNEQLSAQFRKASWCVFGVGGTGLVHSPYVNSVSVGNIRYYDPNPACKNTVICELGVNDVNSGITGVNMDTALGTLMGSTINPITEKRMALTLGSNCGAPAGQGGIYNNLIRARVSTTLDAVGELGDLSVPGDLDVDGLHPLSAGMLVYAEAIEDGLKKIFPSLFGSGSLIINGKYY